MIKIIPAFILTLTFLFSSLTVFATPVIDREKAIKDAVSEAVKYEQGSDGYPKDALKALRFYLEAAQLGNPSAQYSVARLYFEKPKLLMDAASSEQKTAIIKAALNPSDSKSQKLIDSYYEDSYIESYAWFNVVARDGTNTANQSENLVGSDFAKVEKKIKQHKDWLKKANTKAQDYYTHNLLPYRLNENLPKLITKAKKHNRINPDLALGRFLSDFDDQLSKAKKGDAEAQFQIAQRYYLRPTAKIEIGPPERYMLYDYAISHPEEPPLKKFLDGIWKEDLIEAYAWSSIVLKDERQKPSNKKILESLGPVINYPIQSRPDWQKEAETKAKLYTENYVVPFK